MQREHANLNVAKQKCRAQLPAPAPPPHLDVLEHSKYDLRHVVQLQGLLEDIPALLGEDSGLGLVVFQMSVLQHVHQAVDVAFRGKVDPGANVPVGGETLSRGMVANVIRKKKLMHHWAHVLVGR